MPCGGGGSRTRVQSAERVTYSMRSCSINFRYWVHETTRTPITIVLLFHNGTERNILLQSAKKCHRSSSATAHLSTMENGAMLNIFNYNWLLSSHSVAVVVANCVSPVVFTSSTSVARHAFTSIFHPVESISPP